MSDKDPYLVAWDIVIKVIQEAEGRYGLRLYGYVETTLFGYTLHWATRWHEMTQDITFDVFEHSRDPDQLGVHRAMQMIREHAERRDRRFTPADQSS